MEFASAGMTCVPGGSISAASPTSVSPQTKVLGISPLHPHPTPAFQLLPYSVPQGCEEYWIHLQGVPQVCEELFSQSPFGSQDTWRWWLSLTGLSRAAFKERSPLHHPGSQAWHALCYSCFKTHSRAPGGNQSGSRGRNC